MMPCHIEPHVRHERRLIEDRVQQTQPDQDHGGREQREVIPHHHARVDVDREPEPGPRRSLTSLGVAHHDVHRSVVDLDNVERPRSD
jgi:hypothetical protein